MIPSKYQTELATLKSKAAVSAFAQKIRIHPAIVVGRLQYDGVIEPSWMNHFKERISVDRKSF